MQERPTTTSPRRSDSDVTPEVRRDDVIALYHDDRIDTDIIDHKRAMYLDRLPTRKEQRDLSTAIRLGDPTASIDLVGRNSGLIAAVAYPFKHCSPEDFQALLDVGNHALIRVARGFDFRSSEVSFETAALQFIHRELSRRFSNDVRPLFNVYSRHADDELKKFVEHTEDRSTLAERRKRASWRSDRNAGIAFIRSNAAILRRLNNTSADNRARFRIYPSDIRAVLKKGEWALWSSDRETVALACLQAGLEFELPPIPDASVLTERHRSVAERMDLSHEENAARIGMQPNVVNQIATRVRKKIGARTTTEGVIMARLGNYRVSNQEVHPALELFTEYQRRVLPYIFMTDDEMVEMSDDPRAKMQLARAVMRSGQPNRQALALYLQQEGIDFAINEPRKPLHELFDAKQMELVRNLHLTGQEIGELVGMDSHAVAKYTYWFVRKAGARNKTELLLMAHKFDTGERREPVPSTRRERYFADTKRERLAARLGWTSLDAVKLEELMADLKPRTREIIREYYLSDDDNVTWDVVAGNHGIHRMSAIASVTKAVLSMREVSDSRQL